MSAASHIISSPRRRWVRWITGFGSLLAGAGVTLTLFSVMAAFEQVQTPPEATTIDDLHVIAMPAEPPPPRPTESMADATEAPLPLVNLQIGASDSAVKIAVVPPELSMLFPPDTAAPPAHIEVSTTFADLKPKTEIAADPRRIYQRSEVDRAPSVLYRAVPHIPSWIRKNSDTLRLTLIIVSDTTGSVANVRLVGPSGNDGVDKLVLECVKTQWLFTPAIKNGRKVRCLFQQTVTIKWTGSNPFSY